MKIYPVILIALMLPAGCGGHDHDDFAPGSAEITIYGEEFIEAGIPADVFVDGWAVTFDRFLVSVGEVTAAAGDEPPALDEPAYRVYDLAEGSGGNGFPVVTVDLPGGHYDRVGYAIAASTGATAGNAQQADVEAMIAGGLAVHVKGTASKEGVTKSFDWAFTGGTAYGECEALIHVDGGTGVAQLTIHGDHLFYDDLASSEPNVAFQLIADADTDADGAITPAELMALDITAQERYQTGSLDIDNLWDFIDHQVGTLGHIDGEGHCATATRR